MVINGNYSTTIMVKPKRHRKK